MAAHCKSGAFCIINSEGSDYLRKKEVSVALPGSP